MFSNVRALDAAQSGSEARKSLDILIGACAVTLQSHRVPVQGARTLAMEIWTVSHGAATLMLGGHLEADNPDYDPHAILMRSVSAMVEAAIRRPGATAP
jgi:hypothetical protein